MQVWKCVKTEFRAGAAQPGGCSLELSDEGWRDLAAIWGVGEAPEAPKLLGSEYPSWGLFLYQMWLKWAMRFNSFRGGVVERKGQRNRQCCCAWLIFLGILAVKITILLIVLQMLLQALKHGMLMLSVDQNALSMKGSLIWMKTCKMIR